MQTTVVFILAITHVGTWNLFPNPDLYLLSVLNMEWVLVCALLPYLNLAMSSDIRKSLLNVLKITDKTATVSAQGAVTVFNVSTYKKALSKSSE
ncbi:hypothetical protein M3Y97_01129300 [Aphelenchoides bicaudatus]|nr:hypothetical protein M3Y97_01129300 [Aphelenchoides bicaudatus]